MTELATLPAEAEQLVRCAAVLVMADPPRAAHTAFFHPDGVLALPDVTDIGEPGEVTVVLPRSTGLRDAAVPGAAVPVARDVAVVTRTIPAILVPVSEAVPLLARARRDPQAHPAAAFWGAAALVALQLVARGRLYPSVSASGFDVWRLGPLEVGDLARVRELVAAMPAHARATPVPGRSPLELPDPEALVRDFFDAVADGMPRSPAARHLTSTVPYVSAPPQRVADLRDWAAEVSAGIDSGQRISLRIQVDDVAGAGVFRAVVQVASVTDPSVLVDAADLWKEQGADLGPRARIHTMILVRRAATVWRPLQRLLTAAVPDEVELDDEEVEELLGEASRRLGDAGVDVHWPRSMVGALTARATVTSHAASPPSDLGTKLGAAELFSFSWQVALGDEPLTQAELDQLAESRRPVVRLRDRWLIVDPEVLRRARERDIASPTTLDALTMALTGTAEVDGVVVPVHSEGWLQELGRRISDPDDGQEPVGAPAALTAVLRDYQLRGLGWLVRMTSLGLGACLADDMGLGKTVTLIALHLHRSADPATAGPTLVICPASLLGNWEREIARFAPGTAVRRFHGARRDLVGVTDGFVLTTYGTMRRDVAALSGTAWGLVAADEAQHVKNPLSGTAKALRRIPSRSRVALTGTPVENNLSELWAILDWATPGLLGTLPAFRARWGRAVEGGQDEVAARRLARLVQPFLLRRRKSDPGIAPELPPKTETDQLVSLTREQVGLYEAVVRETMAQIEASEGITRRGLILKLLTALKQICNHPSHYLHESGSRLSGRSGKLELLDELLDTITSEGGSVLVFTQYVAMARLLERHLADRGIGTLFLHGGTPVARRDTMVAQFQDGQAPVFLLSLKAAGTGLNLTRADHVIHFDRWWNPAVEEQATDRAYRIGQTRPVQVHRFVAEGTVEDRIAELLTAKRALADAVLGSGEAAFSELTDSELSDLVTLRRST
jgi:superfamily II DNA or RNA helicase